MSKRVEIALVLLLMGGVLLYRLSHLGEYPAMEDELITLKVASSIAETGKPLIGDQIYWRSLLGNYLQALPLLFVEPSLNALRVPSVVCSVLLLPVVYMMGRSLAGRTAGGLAALFLGASAFEGIYASFARFYVPFQFFFVLAVYGAGRFFIAKDRRSGWWLLLAILAAMGTHRLSLELVGVVALAVVLGGDWQVLRSWRFFGALGAIAVVGWGAFLYLPPNHYGGGMSMPLHVGGWGDKFKFYDLLRQFLPFGTTLAILGIVPALQWRNRLWAYYGICSVVLMVVVSLTAPMGSGRYMANVFPLTVVFALASLVWWGRRLWQVFRNRNWPEFGWRSAGVGLVVLLAVVNLVKQENLDLSMAFGTYFTYIDQKPAHEFIAGQWSEGDILISAEPAMTEFYLGRKADYFLRESLDRAAGRYVPFPPGQRHAGLIDDPRMLVEVVRKAKGKVWLYYNWKIDSEVGPPMRGMMRWLFKPVFDFDETHVMVGR